MNIGINVEFGKCSLKESEDEDFSKTDQEEIVLEDIRDGNLYYGEHHSDTKHMPFIMAPYTSDMDKIIRKMFDEWKMPLPKIVIITVAETENSVSDEYRKQSRKLVKGLIHALNTTEMWLCTDGLNHGFSRDIGKALENELSRRKTIEKSLKNTSSAFPEAALIGISRRQNLNFSSKLGPEKVTGGDETEIKRHVNKHHGYFLIVEASTKRGLSHFLLNFVELMRTCENFKTEESKIDLSIIKSETPVIVLLLQGKVTQIDFILGHIKLGLPLIVFEGSGGLADLISYAYHQLTYKPEGINEAEYIEAVLKPQLSDKVRELHPQFLDYKASFLTEKIFDCIRYSKQNDQQFITVLDLTDVDISASSLSSYLLKAVFKSEPSDVARDVTQMKKDLFLTMDWNSPTITREQVFDRDTTGKFQISHEMIYRALTRPHREEFVSLFISQGLSIHSFLDSTNILNLFRNSLEREFFRGVIWESVLGFGASSEISRRFIDSTLIILIEELTGIPTLIDSYELDWNSRGIYDERTPQEAERKAMAVLAMWAILSYRVELVKTIWRHCEQPIHVALSCSIILKKLQTYVTDLSVINEMEKHSKNFSEMAASVMTLCYESVPCRAIDLLKEKNRVWSYTALMELAAFAQNKQFLAHPSCQKYLDNIFMGYIKVKDLPYGDVTIPLWLKIILSAFLVFPMFLWIRFEIPYENDMDEKSLEESGSDNASKEEDQTNLTEKKSRLSFLHKLYYFWSAPITKFWICQVFYLLFLILFSAAVIWPSCGNVFLDFFTCIWLTTIIIDSIYVTYTLNLKYTSTPLVYKCLELALMTVFLFGYVMGRIIWPYTFMAPYTAKVMLCIALLYFYYRFIFIALPISSQLGPMLYRVKRMTTVDFVNYMRVTILVIISNGIVIHAVVFPDYPLNWELIRRAFFDAITAFFLMPIDGYVGTPNPKCIRLMRHPNKMSFVGLPPETCKVGRYLKPNCPNPGVWPYLFGLQYMILLRLILVVMLFALFSNTTRKLEEEGKYIWKYQRYQLVINFANRLTLPPPFSILTLIYLALKFLFYCSCNCLDRYVLKYSRLKGFSKRDKSPTKEELNENDFRFWKSLAMKHHKQQKQKKAEEITTRIRMEHINAVRDDLNKQRRALRTLEGHMNELQSLIINAHQYLKGSDMQISIRERLEAKNVPQIFSRMSPYPNTMIFRYPVSDNHVPWKIEWTTYDPVFYTLPKEDYPPGLRPHVDTDIERSRETEEFQMPNFYWNRIYHAPAGFSVDRQSWITDKSGQAIEYELDSIGLPKNPFGRTGLKGRGSLLRWGPNHYIYVVITQLYEKEQLSPKYLEVILTNKYGLNLPGGYVHTENRYEILKSLFDTEDVWESSEEMINFFESLKETGTSKRRKSVWERRGSKDENEFCSEKVKLGYMDEETNTDHAWCEAEVWHIHYNTQNSVKEKLKIDADWYLLTYEILHKVSPGQAAILHTIATKMKAALEKYN